MLNTLRKYKLTLAFLSALTPALSGCNSDTPTQVGLFVTALANLSDEKVEEELAFLRGDVARRDQNPDLNWQYILGDFIIYLPEDYRQRLTVDKNTFFSTVIGYFLSKSGMDYSTITIWATLNQTAPPVTHEAFNYYKGYGEAWRLATLKDPRNVGISERLALFKKRTGEANGGVVSLTNPDALRRLLLDDEALTKFLADDDYALAWLDKNRAQEGARTGQIPGDLDDYGRNLTPITVGVLPGLAS